MPCQVRKDARSHGPIETVSLSSVFSFFDRVVNTRRTLIRHAAQASATGRHGVLPARSRVSCTANPQARGNSGPLPRLFCPLPLCFVLTRRLCCCALAIVRCISVEARSVAQLKAAVLAEQSARVSAAALPDAPVGAKVADLPKYAGAKKVVQVKPSGVAAQLPGDKENNEDAIKASEFDLRWAVRFHTATADAAAAAAGGVLDGGVAHNLQRRKEKKNKKERECRTSNGQRRINFLRVAVADGGIAVIVRRCVAVIVVEQKSIKEKHIRTAAALVPSTDRTNERFIDMQAKNTRLPLIEPALFNE